MNQPSFITSKLEQGVLTLTLNRPDKMNSFTGEMASQLHASILDAASNEQVRCILLTGAGKGFCAGQDLSEVLPENGKARDLGKIVEQFYNPIITLIRNTEKPFVAAVNGVAAGAGANLAFACDIIIAATESFFVQSFSKVGLIPDSGGTFFLPRIFGLAQATALTFLGEKLTAEKAHALGAVYKVIPATELTNEAHKIAGTLAAGATRGYGLTKRLFNQALSSSLHEQLNHERDGQREAGYTADYAEGVAAFAEKRPPRFTGK